MGRHTPGPWRVKPVAADASDPLLLCGLAIMAGDEDVAYTSPCEDGERTANANLIAAAPIMLDTLRAIEEHHVLINRRVGRDESRSHTLRLVRDAILHATLP